MNNLYHQHEKEYFKRIHIKDHDLLGFDMSDISTYNISEKIAAHCLDMTDKVLIEAIINICKEEGVNDLFLIDKEFIVTAIRNELKRRGK